MSTTNPNMAANVKGLTSPIDFTVPVTNKLKVRALRDLIDNEEMNQTELRLFLDKMDQSARAGLYVTLTALEAAVTG